MATLLTETVNTLDRRTTCRLDFYGVRRRGGALPDGVTASGGRVTFGRALSLDDSGLYQCVVGNGVGVAKADYLMTVTGECLCFFLKKIPEFNGNKHYKNYWKRSAAYCCAATLPPPCGESQ